MNKLNTKFSTPLFLTILLAASCTKETVDIEETTETLIPVGGGIAQSAAGEVKLTVPSGAFPGETKLIIRTDRETNVAGKVGAIYDLSTEPARTSFSQPIVIELSNSDVSNNVTLANFDEATPVPVAGAEYLASSKTARASLTHFSKYGLLRTLPPEQCPAAAPIGESCSAEGLSCEYGQECCCGDCGPSISCQCSGGGWACLNTDRCLGAPIECPERTCEDIEAEYAALTSGTNQSCANGETCQMLSGHCGVGIGGCYQFVNNNVTQDQLNALAQEFTSLGCISAVCQCAQPPVGAQCGSNGVCEAIP
jgi:hypothetical protein